MRVTLLLPLLMLLACGTSATTQCTTRHDPLDPLSQVHILAGAPLPHYRTDPPTSGEHQPVNVRSYRGLRAEPIPAPIQVALLESGDVLVQFSPPITPDSLAPLAAMADVTVAPAVALPAPVVATAWVWRLTCARVSLPEVRHFIAGHAGQGPQRVT